MIGTVALALRGHGRGHAPWQYPVVDVIPGKQVCGRLCQYLFSPCLQAGTRCISMEAIRPVMNRAGPFELAVKIV